MKKTLFILTLFCSFNSLFAQAPQKMSFQAVIRSISNQLVSNANIGMRVSVLQGNMNGTPVYVETQTPSTNINGLASIEIGGGTPITGTFDGINWANGPYFVKTETDPLGGVNYSIIATTQLMSVPYALFAASTSACNYKIGQNVPALGGYIFYLDASGCHGLVCATSNQSTGIQWYNGTPSNTTAFGSCVECGDENSSRIVFNQGAGNYAAKLCYDLTNGGFSDWYLPSKSELNLMYRNIGPGAPAPNTNIGGFSNSFYWSSTEYSDLYGFSQNFLNGNQTLGFKNTTLYVRAVRSF